MEVWQLKQMQGLPLEVKIEKTKLRIREWYEHWEGQVYVSFSGGKDSTVLLDLVRSMYPEVPAVFSDTGLEYPEIKEFIKTIDNVETIRPSKSFKQVIDEYGYPVVSKMVARKLYTLKNPTPNNQDTRMLYLKGIRSDGKFVSASRLPLKYHYLINSPFKISHMCCNVMKHNPIARYETRSKRKALVGTMAAESQNREKEYIKSGCNSFEKGGYSKPLGFWTEQDILKYIKDFNIPYSPIYGEIKEKNGDLYTTGEKRTGCMFCAFGCQMEEGENRFQRMQKTHPQIWDYCINKLGMGEVLDYMGIPYWSQITIEEYMKLNA